MFIIAWRVPFFMGLFDYLKRRVKALNAAKGPSEAVEAPGDVSLKLEEVETFLAGKEEKSFGEAVEKARPFAEQLEDEVRTLREKIEEFSEKRPNSQDQFYKIANQMKQGFDSRSAKLFVSLKFPDFSQGKNPSFSEVAEFQARLLNDLQAFSKTALDNRYLPEFFKEDVAAFSGLVKRIAALARELDSALAPARNRRAASSECRKSLQNVFLERNELGERENTLGFSKEKAEEAEKKLGNCETTLAELEKQGLDAAGRELERVRARKSRLSTEAMQSLSVLQRPFRKLERNCPDRELERVFRDYSSDPWNSLLADSFPETPKLKKACKFLLGSEKELEKDGNARENIRLAAEKITGGAYSPLLKDLGELNRQEEELKKEEAPLAEARKSLETAKKELAEAMQQLKNDEESLNQQQKKADAAKTELENKLSGLAGDFSLRPRQVFILPKR